MTIAPPPADVTLEAKVAFLRQPGSYPDATYRVEAIETQISWVFLTGRHVYKLKKPVCYEFLDFGTLEARRYYCEEEVRLNRRLAHDVYLGTVALSVAAPGHLRLDGAGAVVDWLVQMRRLPTRHMLDYSILHGGAAEPDVVRVAQRLAAFYRDCAPLFAAVVGARQRVPAAGGTAHGLVPINQGARAQALRSLIFLNRSMWPAAILN